MEKVKKTQRKVKISEQLLTLNLNLSSSEFTATDGRGNGYVELFRKSSSCVYFVFTLKMAPILA